jgi:predicted house-cleaning noncanonical NTP pyrophosphatase (MazG superfamily)
MLMVRSSAPFEDIDMRGHFESMPAERQVEDLAKAIRYVAFQGKPTTQNGAPICPVVVQSRVEYEFIGHLSNEYRHAQRAVDFLYEFESVDDPLAGPVTGFRLPRPVTISATHHQMVNSYGAGGVESGLRFVAAWMASQGIRAHVEWVARANKLYVVQLDVDPLPERIIPMSEVVLPAVSSMPKEWQPRRFVAIQNGTDFSDLRKTRSHQLLASSGAFVPPIYVARAVYPDLVSDHGALWDDLRALVAIPLILRFDVPMSRTEWTNLPTVTPPAFEDAKERLRSALSAMVARGIPCAEITLVAHHFIAARASAWSEASPESDEVRIDSILGLPDGLQSFAHDSTVYNLVTDSIHSDVRYKDRFIDADEGNNWLTRRSYPELAREPVLDPKTTREIGQLTRRVARNTGKSTRIMWFLDVVQGAGGAQQPAMPWIVVDEEAPLLDPLSISNLDSQRVRRLVDLHERLAVRDRYTLNRFRVSPAQFDIGGCHILLQPDASVVRDRKFVDEFAAIVLGLGNRWKVAYLGSSLAHTLYQLRQSGVSVVSLNEPLRRGRRVLLKKLVRDLIPARIEAMGEHADYFVLDSKQYLLALRQKIVEEALEVAYSVGEHGLREELADLLAVATALAVAEGDSWSDVEAAEREKRERRGGFAKRLYLRSTGAGRVPSSDEPGGAKPHKLKARNGVRVPLVPPLLGPDMAHTLKFANVGLSIEVRYREDAVDVVVKRLADRRDSTSDAQLTLPLDDPE